MPDDSDHSADSDILDDVLRHGLVESVFQPVLDLDTAEVAGYEALSRGPAGPLRSPDALFSAARATGRLTELDWLCRTTAIDTARTAGVRFPLSVLINAEPETLLADRDDPSRWGEFADLRCYCELTERALARDPGRLAAAVDQIRAQDWGVALDDVGVEPASMALLPLLQPDIVKLDASLLRPPTTPTGVDVAQVVHAALTQAAHTGAAVIAEGIETETDRDLARAYGVTYGQGFLLGRPGPLPQLLPTLRTTMPLVPRILDRAIDPGPFAVLASAQPIRALTLAALAELARQLLVQATTLVPAPAVLVTSPIPLAYLADLADEVHTLLSALAHEPRRTPVLGILGHPQPALPVTALADSDPAARDFAVAVVTAHFAAAVTARPNVQDARLWDAGLTFDRATATAVANSLLIRLH